MMSKLLDELRAAIGEASLLASTDMDPRHFSDWQVAAAADALPHARGDRHHGRVKAVLDPRGILNPGKAF